MPYELTATLLLYRNDDKPIDASACQEFSQHAARSIKCKIENTLLVRWVMCCLAKIVSKSTNVVPGSDRVA